jgi:hypothetical protein
MKKMTNLSKARISGGNVDPGCFYSCLAQCYWYGCSDPIGLCAGDCNF